MATRFAGSNPQVSSFMGGGLDLNAIGEAGMQGHSSQEQMATMQTGKTIATGLDAMGQVKSAAEQARGIVAQGEAQAAGIEGQGMQSMIGKIAGGLGSLKLFG